MRMTTTHDNPLSGCERPLHVDFDGRFGPPWPTAPLNASRKFSSSCTSLPDSGTQFRPENPNCIANCDARTLGVP